MLRRGEEGQTAVEFGIILTIFLMLSAGLLDVGRGFYQYNAVSAAARYGSRWGGVVGGACILPGGGSSVDWCTQLGSANTNPGTPGITGGGFWTLNGNRPLQGAGISCPQDLSGSSSYYYTVSDFQRTQDTSIVGAIAQRFDTDSSRSSFIVGGATPGFDLSQMKVCIELPTINGTNIVVAHGDPVRVFVYYPFQAAGPLLGNVKLPLYASAQYIVE